MTRIVDTWGLMPDVLCTSVEQAQKQRAALNRKLNVHGRFWVRST